MFTLDTWPWQSEHAVLPDAFEKVRPEQRVHAPFTTAEPAGHIAQDVAPAGDVDPEAQRVQLVELAAAA